MWGNTVRGWGACEIPMRLTMNDGAVETVERMLTNIWCMLDLIILFFHKTAKIHFLGISCSLGECTI